MTTVVAKKTKHHITLACDTQVTYGHYKLNGDTTNKTMKDFSKIYRVGNIAFGSAGTLEESLRFKRYVKTNIPKGTRIDDIEDYFVQFYDEQKKINSNFVPSNHYLFVYKSSLFAVQQYSIREVPERSAIGSGMFFAITALKLGKTPKEAVQIAIELDLYSSGEVEMIKIKI